jgi:hypothetical protein
LRFSLLFTEEAEKNLKTKDLRKSARIGAEMAPRAAPKLGLILCGLGALSG